MLAVACGDEDAGDGPVFTDPGTSFRAEVGDRFEVVLESDATTGFAWALSADLPANVVELVSDTYEAPDTDLAGAPGLQRMVFEATGDGSTFIQLWYIRSFDNPPDPTDRAQFEVVVGSGDPSETIPSADIDEPVEGIPDDEDAIDIETLMDQSPAGNVIVLTVVFDDGSGMVMCEALAESFPPQCPGRKVAIENPEVVQAVPLTEEGQVQWSDRPVLLYGSLGDAGFRVIAAALAS